MRPHRQVDFSLADGSTIRRQVGDAYFELQGEGGALTGDLWQRRRQAATGCDDPLEHWAGCRSIQTPFDPDAHVARLSNDSIASTPKGFGSIDIRWDFERGIAHVRELPIPGLAGEAMPLEFERRGQ